MYINFDFVNFLMIILHKFLSNNPLNKKKYFDIVLDFKFVLNRLG